MAEPTQHCTQSAPTQPDSALNDPDRWNQKYMAANASNESGVTTDEDNRTLSLSRPVYQGYYSVRLSLLRVAPAPSWIIGKGSGRKFGPTRNVDILLAAPGSGVAPNVRAIHAFLTLHAESGVWMLKPSITMTVEDESVDEAVALYRRKTHFNIGSMHYLIEFMERTPQIEREYKEERDRILQSLDIPLPRTSMSGLPPQTITVLRSIVLWEGIGSGTYGFVCEGFHPKNGYLLVAKRVSLRSKSEIPGIEQEIHALRCFNGQDGILALVDWQTPFNGRELRKASLPVDVYLVREKGVAFNEYDWTVLDWTVKRRSLYQLLGLEAIHQAGCMHRDITARNLLFFPYVVPQHARLCDFGKFYTTPQANDTCIAAWRFLPPELEEGKHNHYDQSLDIWLLGLAIANTWWTSLQDLRPRTVSDHRRLLEFLMSRVDDSAGVADLLVQMLARDPQRRPSAGEALVDRCFRNVEQGKPPIKTSDSKRPVDNGP
ncbi:MAG: hypothetical protein Q9176_006142 [Flavoplaca citrina]